MGRAFMDKNMEDMARQLSEMKGHHVGRAMARAMNDTFRSARQQMVVKTADKDKVPQDKVRNKIRFDRKRGDFATPKRLTVRLAHMDVGIPLISLVTNKGSINFNKIKGQNKNFGKKRSRLGGTGIRLRVGNKFFPRAFFAVIRKSQKGHILQRKGDKSRPVGVPRIHIEKTINKIARPEINHAKNTVFERVLRHEYVQRWNGVIK